MASSEVIGLLQTFAEIAAAFAGFAALVSIFRANDRYGAERIHSIGSVVSIALTTIGAAMLPAILLTHIEAAVAWRLCSIVFIVVWASGVVIGIVGYRRVSGGSLAAEQPLFFAISTGTSAVGLLLLIWNVISPEPPEASLRYLLALLAQLAIAALAFMVGVFSPDEPEDD